MSDFWIFCQTQNLLEQKVIWFELLKQHAQLVIKNINGAVGLCCAVEDGSTGLPSPKTTAQMLWSVEVNEFCAWIEAVLTIFYCKGQAQGWTGCFLVLCVSVCPKDHWQGSSIVFAHPYILWGIAAFSCYTLHSIPLIWSVIFNLFWVISC